MINDIRDELIELFSGSRPMLGILTIMIWVHLQLRAKISQTGMDNVRLGLFGGIMSI